MCLNIYAFPNDDDPFLNTHTGRQHGPAAPPGSVISAMLQSYVRYAAPGVAVDLHAEDEDDKEEAARSGGGGEEAGTAS